MKSLILIVPAAMAFLSTFIIFFMQAKPRNDILFGSALPSYALEDTLIKQLQASFTKAYSLFGAIAILAAVPFFWLERYFIIGFVYLLIWYVSFLYGSKLIFNRYNRHTISLKREKEWFVGQKRILRLDSKINRLKQMSVLSPYWFLIPALISVGLLITSISDDNLLLKMTAFASLAMTVIIFALYWAFRSMKPKLYSKKRELNTAINLGARRYWSVLWLCMAIFESLNAIMAYTILTSDGASDFYLWIIGGVMVSLVPLGAILFVHNKVRLLEVRLLEEHINLTDDDEFWINGTTYYNPNDPSILVPSRIGIGKTFNMGTRKGKWLQYSFIVLVMAIVLPLAAFGSSSNTAAPILSLDESGTISIVYSGSDYTFHISELQQLTMEESLPSGFRTGGTATAQYARGEFTLEELGTAKLYVFKNTAPYISMKLENHFVIYNEQDPAATRALFEKLSQLYASH